VRHVGPENHDRSSPALVDDIRAVLAPFIAARVLLIVAWLLAAGIADHLHASRPEQLGEGLLAWDGTWYRDIAQVGYRSLPAEGVRFFPLYPMLGRALAVPFGSAASVPLVLIANFVSFGLAILVRRLVIFERRDVALADRSVWAICLFPPSFVLCWAYSESMMLLAAVGAFFCARRGRWWWAAACGVVAGATRPVGLAVAAAMVIEALRDVKVTRLGDRVARGAAVVAPALGAGAYLAWVNSTYGSWSLPFDVQTDLRGEANPAVRVIRGIGDIFGVERFGDGLHVPFALGFIALLVITFRRWPASYGVYATLVLLAALSASNLNSVERYALNAFPIVLTFALVLKTQRWERLGLAVCGSGFVALASLAWLGVYVP